MQKSKIKMQNDNSKLDCHVATLLAMTLLLFIIASVSEAISNSYSQDTEKAERGSLCFPCHPDFKDKNAGYGHKPFIEEDCSRCHKFHGDNPKKGNLKKNFSQADIDLCYSCHPNDKLGLSHPVGGNMRDPNTGYLLTCTSTCHDPHGSEYRFILRQEGGKNLCISCHKELVEGRGL